MRTACVLIALLFAAGFPIPNPCAAAETEAPVYDLSFTPAAGEAWTVEYGAHTTWEYPDDKMKGELDTKLLLRWKTSSVGDTKSQAKAEHLRVTYTGQGEKQGAAFKYDVFWTREKGYERGESDEATQRWVGKEIESGISLVFDRRGAADPGAG